MVMVTQVLIVAILFVRILLWLDPFGYRKFEFEIVRDKERPNDGDGAQHRARTDAGVETGRVESLNPRHHLLCALSHTQFCLCVRVTNETVPRKPPIAPAESRTSTFSFRFFQRTTPTIDSFGFNCL